MEELYLALDSGGSKTVWILLDREGHSHKKLITRGLAAAKEGTLPIAQTVAEAYAALSDFPAPARIFLSLGGPNVGEIRDALSSVWSAIPITIEREACGDAILRAATLLGCPPPYCAVREALRSDRPHTAENTRAAGDRFTATAAQAAE